MTDPTPYPDQSLRLYLIRHGETAWSLSGQHTGRTDIALTAGGEAQALALAPVLHAIGFEHILSSPAQRARRTCALAAPGLPPVEILPDLAEWDYGDYEGRTSRDIRRGRHGWSCYHDGCPSGESPADVTTRAERLIARLCLLAGNVALFSHGQFGCALAARWIGQPVTLGEPNHPGLRVIAQWNDRPQTLPQTTAGVTLSRFRL